MDEDALESGTAKKVARVGLEGSTDVVKDVSEHKAKEKIEDNSSGAKAYPSSHKFSSQSSFFG